MEHSENKIITHSALFGNGVGPLVLQYRVQSAWVLQECQKRKAHATESVLSLSLLFVILPGHSSRLHVFESWIEVLQVQPRFRNTHYFIFGILCWLNLVSPLNLEPI